MHSPYYPDLPAYNGDALWWFDEYAVDGQGRAIDVYATPAPHPLVNIRTDLLEQMQFAAAVRPGLGYLGYPVTGAITLTEGVYRRDFERGIVLGNFSPLTVTLTLEKPYRKIQGIQDPQTNDGTLATSVTLPAHDGLILLDPAAFGGAPAPTPTLSCGYYQKPCGNNSTSAHQRVLGSQFIFVPADPAAYNLMVKQLAGVTPVYPAAAPLMDADYNGLVYKSLMISSSQPAQLTRPPGRLTIWRISWMSCTGSMVSSSSSGVIW
jgi:hypothetical protein